MLLPLMFGVAMASEAPASSPLPRSAPLQVAAVSSAYAAAGLLTLGTFAAARNRTTQTYTWGWAGVVLGTAVGLVAFPSTMATTRKAVTPIGAQHYTQLRWIALSTVVISYSAFAMTSGPDGGSQVSTLLVATTFMARVQSNEAKNG